MGVSGFGFGRLAIALVFGISTGIGAPSSLLFVKTFAVGGVGTYLEIGLMWTRSLKCCVPVACLLWCMIALRPLKQLSA